tara:strand:- start:262 stop:678 length:417 start_codon:yes stop_codon:yes gene_type:complete
MSTQRIKFCPLCDNKYYHKLVDNKENGNNDQSLVYYCRVCGHQDENITGACVLNIQYDTTSGSGSNANYEYVINRYTKYDPTLPHIQIPCPNEDCKSNNNTKDANTDAVYIRYDHDNMRHLYMCTDCDFVWKTHDVNT